MQLNNPTSTKKGTKKNDTEFWNAPTIQIVGTLQHSRNFYYVVPDDPRLVHDVYVRRRQLVGRRSRKRFSVGDEVRVFVVRVDAFKRQVYFAIASEGPMKRGRSKGCSMKSKAARA